VRGIQHLERGEAQPYRDTVQRLAIALGLTPRQRDQFEAAAQPRPRRRRGEIPTAAAAEPLGETDRPEHVFALSSPEQTSSSSLAHAGERKRVTVIYFRVATFRTLALRLDPARADELLEDLTALVSRTVQPYGGTVSRSELAGHDEFVVLFGAPISQEDHTIRALHAALRLQEAFHSYEEALYRRWRVPFRVSLSVHTASSVIVPAGNTARVDQEAGGGAVTRARQVHALTRPGAILVTDDAYRAAGDLFAWRLVGRLPLEGDLAPAPVYELLGTRPHNGLFDVLARRGLTRFVGREPELEQLRSAWHGTREGRGQVVAVIGEAGIGKTRLIHEFKQRLVRERVTLGESSCFAYGEVISYLPFLEIVKSFFGIDERTTDAEARRRIHDHLAALSLDPNEWTPYLLNLLAFSVDDAGFSELPLPLIRRRTIDALKSVLLAQAHRQAVVLILEDVHWIDKASGDVLTALVEELPTASLLIILAYRSELLHAWAAELEREQSATAQRSSARNARMLRALLAKPYAVRIPLERLAPARSQALVQGILGPIAVPTELEQMLATRADGNPLFIEELTHSILDSGDLVEHDGRYVLTKPLTALDLPTTVQGVLLARIDQLAPSLKSVVQAASAIGPLFGYALLASIVDAPAALDEHLLKLEDLEFVYPIRLTPEPEYSFKHALTQEAVYDTLLDAQREAYHEQIGQALEALYSDRLEESYELLAHHYARSTNQDKAIEYLDRANLKAAKANAVHVAHLYFSEGMRLLDSMPDTTSNRERRISMLVNQPLVFWALLRYKDYYDLLIEYEDMAVGLENRHLLAAYYARMGWSQWTFGHLEEAVSTTAKGISLYEAIGDTEELGIAYNTLQRSHLFLGNYDQALYWYEKAMRAFEHSYNLRWYAMAASIASWAYDSMGLWSNAIEVAAEALRLGEEAGDKNVISFLNGILCATYTHQGDVARAIHHGQSALGSATTPVDLLWAECWLAGARCLAGEAVRGVERLAEIVPLVQASGSVPTEIVFTLQLAEAYWLAGALDQAQTTLEKILVLAERTGMMWHLGSAHRLLGEVALSASPAPEDLRRAGAHFEASIEVLRGIRAEKELALAYRGYAGYLRQRGDRLPAREYLMQALEIFERLGALLEPRKVRQALRELAADSGRRSA
jgi:class 3 adenylate cyclase/tetratricopeptide (TPR) repeat protein